MGIFGKILLLPLSVVSDVVHVINGESPRTTKNNIDAIVDDVENEL